MSLKRVSWWLGSGGGGKGGFKESRGGGGGGEGEIRLKWGKEAGKGEVAGYLGM